MRLGFPQGFFHHADGRNLRPNVEVEQLQAVEHVVLTQTLHDF
jgi:hypothetical protein